MRITTWALTALLVTAMSTFEASAEPPPSAGNTRLSNFLSGYFGEVVHGCRLDEVDRRRPLVLGGALGFLVRGPLMGEVDVMHGREFFGAVESLGPNNLTTVTANLLVGPVLRIPKTARQCRPYGVAGGGVMLSRIEAFGRLGSGSNTRGVVDVGAGVICSVSRRIGVRAEYRYFRAFGKTSEDWETVDAWTFSRLTVGLAWMW